METQIKISIEMPQQFRDLIYEHLPGELTLEAVTEEIVRARQAHPGEHSLRHLHDVLREEEDELWAEIKKNPRIRDKQRIRDEAIQVAAMALAIYEAI